MFGARVLLGVLLPVAAFAQQGEHKVVKTDVERWMKELSNWERWGKDDELGARRQFTTLSAGSCVPTSLNVANWKTIELNRKGSGSSA